MIIGKPVFSLFANYKAGLGRKNENSSFNLGRAFVGYEGFFDLLDATGENQKQSP